MRLAVFLSIALMAAAPMQAECAGQNLIAALPADQRAALQAAADAVPFPKGNLWSARKGTGDITLIGTFHLDDPRHEATLAAVAASVALASVLLVEAGPDEEAQLQSYVTSHPERLVNKTGPTLPEVLSDADWTRLSQALQARGVPAVFTAKLQPWYVSSLLSVPACQFSAVAQNGLDKRLMAAANDRGLPVKALEPFDTLFTIFDDFTPAEQIDMLIQTLDTTGTQENDIGITLSDSYFAGDNRLFWEFTRAQVLALPGADPAKVAAEFAKIEEALMARRNRTWIPVIEAAAAQGPVVAAFGALHLSGDDGVLNLLAKDGWTVLPLAP